MAFNYTSLQNKVLKKIEKFGMTGTLTSSTTTSSDPLAPWEGNSGGSTSNITVVLANLSLADKQAFGVADEITEQKKAIIAVQSGVDPQPDDIITVNNEVWRLVRGKRIAPAGVNVVFIFVVKK